MSILSEHFLIYVGTESRMIDFRKPMEFVGIFNKMAESNTPIALNFLQIADLRDLCEGRASTREPDPVVMQLYEQLSPEEKSIQAKALHAAGDIVQIGQMTSVVQFSRRFG